jgi:hypothetical protein
MTAPSHSPSITVLEERLRIEARLQALEETQQRFEEQKLSLISLGAHYGELQAQLKQLPESRFTPDDEAKIGRLEVLIREQAQAYTFSTFAASEIEISSDTYRPQKEGFEIGFELSASDAIRLKWAYQIALLELARSEKTNHPGFVVFDEPRQQAASKVSFQRLLERAAVSKASGQQVIFATSEDREQLEAFIGRIDCSYTAFNGHIISRVTR